MLQALGLEVRSVLAIGGIGGLAIGLAGREICENLLNGFLLMTTVSVWVLGGGGEGFVSEVFLGFEGDLQKFET